MKQDLSFQEEKLKIAGIMLYWTEGSKPNPTNRIRTVDFAKRIKLDLAQFAVLTPLPGTRLMEKLKKEGRIVEKDWSMYDFGTPVFKPSKM